MAHLIAADDPVVVAGRADIGEERCSLIVDKMESLIALRDRNATQGLLTFNEDDSFEDHLDKLYAVFKRHAGACPIKVRVGLNTGGEHVVALRDSKDTAVMVMPSEALCEEIEQIFGEPVLTFI